MINADRDKFIKQYIELYGEELFLDTSIYKSKIQLFKTPKAVLLNNLISKIFFNFSFTDTEIKNKLVFGSGDPNADLIIVGESPNEHEIENNKPFLGSPGKLLDKILKAIGLTRSSKVYLTYLIKNEIEDSRDPLKSELVKFLPFLREEIKIIEPKIIVGLGKVVGKALINKDSSLDKMRSKIHSFYSYPLKITYSPNSLLREQSLKKLAWKDFQFIRDFLN